MVISKMWSLSCSITTECPKSLEPITKILRRELPRLAVNPDMLKRIQRNMVHRLRKCVAVGDGHLEHTVSKR
jgi:hypothetical protein